MNPDGNACDGAFPNPLDTDGPMPPPRAVCLCLRHLAPDGCVVASALRSLTSKSARWGTRPPPCPPAPSAADSVAICRSQLNRLGLALRRHLSQPGWPVESRWRSGASGQRQMPTGVALATSSGRRRLPSDAYGARPCTRPRANRPNAATTAG